MEPCPIGLICAYCATDEAIAYDGDQNLICAECAIETDES